MSRHDDQESGTDDRRNGASAAVHTVATLQDYRRMYADSVENRDGFWADLARSLTWDVPFETVVEENLGDGSAAWFADGSLNASVNALDAMIGRGMGDAVALRVLDGDDWRELTYRELLAGVEAFAGGLKRAGVSKGDRVVVYLPDGVESVVAMLGCARMGVVYVLVPYNFTGEIAAKIMDDCEPSLLLVSGASGEESYNAHLSHLREESAVPAVVDVTGSAGDVIPYASFVKDVESPEPVSVEAEHPLFIIYANSIAVRGSVFPTAGFLVQAKATFDMLFRARGDLDIRQCFSTHVLASATGQAYGLWGGLLTGTGSLFSPVCDGVSTETLRKALDIDGGTVLLTSPHLLSRLRREIGDGRLDDERSFAMVFSSGDVLSPRLVSFAGKALVPGPECVCNLWIQSESGTALIATLPCSEMNRNGALGLPLYGVEPVVLNTVGVPCKANESGQLTFNTSWPSMIRTIWRQPDRYHQMYFQRFPGHFDTNDGVRVDNDGFFWFMGRLDDIIKIRGQSLSTSEIESVIVAHPDIAEAAVVGVSVEENDEVVAFLALEPAFRETERGKVKNEIVTSISRRVGDFAVPTAFVFGKELPRTKTGKLLRRVLRRIAKGDISQGEDLSHVANPNAVIELVNTKRI